MAKQKNKEGKKTVSKKKGASLKKAGDVVKRRSFLEWWEQFITPLKFSWLKREVKDFLQVFREPEAWVFVVLGFVFATKALEVLLSAKGKMPLFSFLV